MEKYSKLHELSDDVVTAIQGETPDRRRVCWETNRPRQLAGRGFRGSHVFRSRYCRIFAVEAVLRRGYGLHVKIGAMVPDG